METQHTRQPLWQPAIQPGPAQGVERLLPFVSVEEAALEESKSALCFSVPLPDMFINLIRVQGEKRHAIR